jgi:hypothetical protein|tara:strand:+ start:463 stop:822 length:360 start_codon:yes stop_codon:yes gene_type:complete
MGILKTIFGSGDVISKGMDLIDDMYTSDAEMVEAKAKAKQTIMASYAPFKIAQRYLALMFGLSYVLSFWICLGLVFLDKPMAPVIEVMEVFSLSMIMIIIVTFYFGGGLAEGVMGKKKS